MFDMMAAIPLWAIPAVWLIAVVVLGVRRTPIIPLEDGDPLPALQRGSIDALAFLVYAFGPFATIVLVTFDPAVFGRPFLAFVWALAIMFVMPGLGALLQHLISQRMPVPPPPGFMFEGATVNGKPLD